MQKIILMMFLTFGAAASLADGAEVRLRPEVHPTNPIVRLGDVAEIHGTDEQRVKELAAVELFPAPSAGQRRFIRLREILEILDLRSIDLRDCRLEGASIVAILGPPLEEETSPRVLKTPRPATPLKPTHENQPSAVVLAVAAARPVSRGQVIEPADVQLAAFPAATANESLLHNVEFALGQESTRSLAPGQPISARDLRKPTLVRRRESVRVAVIAPGVRISADGIAAEDGSHGDWILIESPYRQEKVRARVCGLKQVEVYTGGMQPPP